MSTDSTQVMRVLDRCLDTARTGSGTIPAVAAAASLAKADPDIHDAISQLLARHNNTSWQAAMAAVREAGSGNFACIERCEKTSPVRQILSSCTAASQAAGEADQRTAAILAQMVLAAAMLEMSSLGGDRSRQLRNRVVHRDITAARALSRRLADRPQETSR